MVRNYYALMFLLMLSISSCYKNPYWVNGWKNYSVNQVQEVLKKEKERAFFNKLTVRSDSVFASRVYQQNVDSILPFKIIPNTREVNFDFRRGVISVLAVTNGYLIGVDRGEWDGNLYWFSKDGKHNYKISNDQIVQFVTRNGKIYAIQGLTHLGSFISGSIVEISQASNKWKSITYLNLSSTPRSIANDQQNDFIVACTDNLLKVHSDKKIDTLVKKDLWNKFYYPTSIVIRNNIAYIGMQQCVFRYNLLTRKQDLLINQDLNFGLQ